MDGVVCKICASILCMRNGERSVYQAGVLGDCKHSRMIRGPVTGCTFVFIANRGKCWHLSKTAIHCEQDTTVGTSQADADGSF